MEKVLIPVLVKYRGNMPKRIDMQIKKVIEAVIKKFREKHPDYLNILEGPNFPQATELEQFIALCEVVREKYICLSPLDEDNQPFAERLVRCGDALNDIKQRFESKQYGAKEDFSKDLPFHLSNLIDGVLFDKLLEAKNF